MKKILSILCVVLFMFCVVGHATPERALKGPNGTPSLLGVYNGETKRVVTNSSGYPIISLTGDITVSDSTPALNFKDTDCTDSDINAQILASATDTGSGTEDIDVTYIHQVAGSDVAYKTVDADGDTTFITTDDYIFTANSDTFTINLDGTDAYLNFSDGGLIVQTNESANADTALTIKSVGTSDNADLILQEGNGTTISSIFKIRGTKTAIDCLGATEFVLNDFSGDVDTRVESDNVTNMFIVDADIDSVGIGGVTPVSGSRLCLPSEDDAVTPTFAFGDCDTGIFERIDDALRIAIGGTGKWEISGNVIAGVVGSSPSMLNETATSTNPVFAPAQGDSNTGIGWASADQLSLIAGGVEGLRLTENGGVVLSQQVNAGLTASTTQSQGQGALTSSINEISTVANANDVVTLPSATPGSRVIIINNGANTLQIFPASGDDLGAGVDTSTTLASGNNLEFWSYDSTNWER